MKIINPYADAERGVWLKGNLHTHTQASACGHYPDADVVKFYSDRIMRYDFIAITDHMKITDVEPFENQNELIVFNGTEFKKDAYQMLGININKYDDDGLDTANHQKILDDIAAQHGIGIICHPHLNRDDYWPCEKLLELEGYTAIEIYNQNVKMNNSGRAVATDVWDKLLSCGRRVWGIASDDFHHYSRGRGGFINVLAKEKSKAAILEAVKAGSFYSSSGIMLKNIYAVDKTITLANASPKMANTIFRFFGKDGKLLKEELIAEPDRPASYTVQGSEGYVRAEAAREDGAQAWTQPFFITGNF